MTSRVWGRRPRPTTAAIASWTPRRPSCRGPAAVEHVPVGRMANRHPGHRAAASQREGTVPRARGRSAAGRCPGPGQHTRESSPNSVLATTASPRRWTCSAGSVRRPPPRHRPAGSRGRRRSGCPAARRSSGRHRVEGRQDGRGTDGSNGSMPVGYPMESAPAQPGSVLPLHRRPFVSDCDHRRGRYRPGRRFRPPRWSG